MVQVYFWARPALWPEYEAPLTRAFAAEGLSVTLTNDAPDPAEVDYMVYAPAKEDDDLTAFSRVKLIQSLWAGPDKLLKNPTLTQPLARMVDPGMTQGMVDYVMGHVLRHHLGTVAYEGAWTWDRVPLAPPLAQDRTVCFLGLGELGAACALKARDHGFRVIGWARSPKDLPGIDSFHGEEGLAQALAQAEILVTLLPRTPATEGLLNATRLSSCRTGVMIVNPGRGELIDDDALLAALVSGQVGAATLDVFRTEPLPADHPFWADPRVMITPHIASETRPESASRVVAANIAGVERGEPPRHLIDRARSY
ncbi:MAG: glyoxylate/hydroxypyruvate reductase A [Pseudomonadota bacterium]